MMYINRIILIGNGFGLAHDKNTSYTDVIKYYWFNRIKKLFSSDASKDPTLLCNISTWDSMSFSEQFKKFRLDRITDPNEALDYLDRHEKSKCLTRHYNSEFFENINKFIEERGWVDIEYQYYKCLTNPTYSPESLNSELKELTNELVGYLNSINIEITPKPSIQNKIFEEIKKRDICISKQNLYNEYINYRNAQHFNKTYEEQKFKDYDKEYKKQSSPLLPDKIMLLNFNYTHFADLYIPQKSRFTVNHIHGELSKPESIIFGYGDELDDDYQKILKLNNNEYLDNMKSIHYLESKNYRDLLSFINEDPFQIYIMGHSCGNSDRTLLNTLFEHKNCITIKPFYHLKEDGTDDYLDKVKNITRNFTDMQLMRDLVVNKEFCEPLS